MRVVEYNKYGGPEVLEITEANVPTPKDNEVLIKIYATSVTTTEAAFRKGEPWVTRLFTGITKPKINVLGEELAGKVVAKGKAVTAFNIGDEVFGTAGPEFGANADFISLPEDGVLALRPNNLSYGEAAASVDGFLTALPFLRDEGNIKAGQDVLIYGASGSVGSAAVQVAKYYGANVTAVCSGRNIELVKSIGANEVINYKEEDFTTNGKTYDIIFDSVGKITFPKSKKSLKSDGIFLEAGIGVGVMRHVMFTSITGGKKAKVAATGLRPENERRKDLNLLKRLLEKGAIKPVIDKSYSLWDITKAHTYVDKGRKRGNVVIQVVE